MDLYDVVRDEDRRILAVLQRLVEAAAIGPAQGARRLDAARAGLEGRRRAMERIVYPILRASPLTRQGVDRSVAEFDLIHETIERLRGTDPADPAFRPAAEHLYRLARVFLEREHREIFSRVWQAIPEEQAERLGLRLSRELAERRDEAEGG